MKCEICKSKKNIQRHHIKPKIFNGDDIDDNIVNICHKCHKLIHRIGIFNYDDIETLKEYGFEGYFIEKYALEYECKYSVRKLDYETMILFSKFILDKAVYSKSKHSELIKTGLANAKQSGRIGGRPKVNTDNLPKNFTKYYEQWKNKDIKKIEFARFLSVSRPTLDLYIATYEKG